MNNHNIKTWKEDNLVHAEWADRSPDDEDRYADDSIIIVGYGTTEKEARSMLSAKYDQWIRETRS